MHGLHECVSGWMRSAGMTVRLDSMGNLIGRYAATADAAPTFLIGSHLDTVPNAGAYDGVLGVLLGIAAVEALGGRRLPFTVEVLAFSEEEGVRFRTPYLGSLAAAGHLDSSLLDRVDAAGISVAEAIRHYGLDPSHISAAAYQPEQLLGYLEMHIEQGPVLESLNAPLGVVDGIAGQSRLWLRFEGKAGHAGTSPMELRLDALAAAAEFTLAVERLGRVKKGLRGTVGQITIAPGAVNVIPGLARLSLDLRHARDDVREPALASLLKQAQAIARHRGVRFAIEQQEHHAAVPSDPALTARLSEAVRAAGHPVHRLISGAGHDAAVMAKITPMAMLFVRSPGGISHHPAEAVLPEDVEAALAVTNHFLESWSAV